MDDEQSKGLDIDPTWAMGIIFVGDGVIIKAYPETQNRTEIVVAPNTKVGALVRNPETNRWRYDDDMRAALGIEANPEFETGAEAGNELGTYLPPCSQILALMRPGYGGHS